MAQGEALGSEGWEGSGRLGGDPAVNIIYIMRKSGTYGGVASSGILSRFDCNSNLTNSTNDVALPGRARAETVD